MPRPQNVEKGFQKRFWKRFSLGCSTTLKISYAFWIFLAILSPFFFATDLFSYTTKKNKEPELFEICPERVYSTKKIIFTQIEKNFMCENPGIEAWSRIPLAQVKFHLTTFLQQRSYFQPTFTERGRRIILTPGKTTRVSKLTVEGAPKALRMYQKRKVIGHLLTPSFLNEIEKWIIQRLQTKGYPCPEVKSKADPETGEIFVSVNEGDRLKLVEVKEEPVDGLTPGALRRFDAFVIGKRFNNNLLSLTEDRTEQARFVQSTHFTAECKPEGAVVTQRVIGGRSRILNVGVGANTEGLVIGKASWRHSRLGKNASIFDVSGYASYKKQSVAVSSEWYAWSPSSRWHLLPLVSVSHEREIQYHFLSANAGFGLARTIDTQRLGWQFSAGPNLNYVDTYQGAEEGLTRFFSLRYTGRLMSHGFEYYQNSPRTGFQMRLEGDLNNKNILSDITAQTFRLSGEYLYNVRGYDPPLLVFGVRGGFNQTFVKDDPSVTDRLPPNYRFYLGGSTDLRGFSLNELPNSTGGLSAAYGSVEIRLSHVLPLWIEPLVFLDAGILGDRPLHFNAPLYYSPGGGVRVESPIGVFRATIAKGFEINANATSAPTHFQYFVGLGEEF